MKSKEEVKMEKIKNFTVRFLNCKILVASLMAMFSYIAICNQGVIKVYDPISWLIFFLLILFFYQINFQQKEYKKDVIYLSILFAFILVFGSIVYQFRNDKEISVFRELITGSSFLSLIGFFNLLYAILIRVIPKLFAIKTVSTAEKVKKPAIIFLISFILIFLCWMPYFLSFYPGGLSPDSLYELRMIINDFTSLSDHHSLLHVFVIAIPFQIGMALFNDINIAVACATLFQMIIMALIFASVLTFLANRKVNKIILLLVLLYYAIVPIHGYYSITMWKDVIFSGLVLLLTMEVIKLFEKEKTQSITWKNMLGFIFVSILCVFFRNNAIYMYVLLAISILCVFWKQKKTFFATFGIVFAIFVIVKGPVFSYFEVRKSASEEYLAMPLQQIGRMVWKDSKLTPKEEELINQVLPVEEIKRIYDPEIADNIKFHNEYNRDAINQNKGEYFKLWFGLVLKHPVIALEAYANSTLGYWYPGVEYWAVYNYVGTNNFSIYSENLGSKELYNLLVQMEQRTTPILNMEWSIGLCFWAIYLFGYLTKKKKGNRYLLIFAPIAGIWLTVMIAAPVFGELRYVYSAFTCLPVLLVLPFLEFKEEKSEKICQRKK